MDKPESKSIKVVPMSQWSCKQLSEKYELGNKLGHGAYGLVYSAVSINNPDAKFALKKMENYEQREEKQSKQKKQSKQGKVLFGFPITTFREIKLLQNLEHENILNIVDVVYEKSQKYRALPIIYLCLDLMDIDLAPLIDDHEYEFTPYRIQKISQQILRGLKYLHEKNIAHRDLKPQNVLMNVDGVVKVADFGLAKKLSKFSTPLVVTLWYRAPELILGMKKYSTNIDVWSLGCMIIEFILRKPLFYDCHIEKQVINKIFELMGTPDKLEWNDAEQLQNYEQFKPSFSKDSEIILFLKKQKPEIQSQPLLLDLIDKMLRLNPNSRYTAQECLNHAFFSEELEESALLPESVLERRRNLDQSKDNFGKRIKYH